MKSKTSPQKDSELLKLKEILLGTIDYLNNNPELTVSSDEDSLDDIYQHYRDQIGKYFQQRRVDRLQHRLSHFCDILIGRVDLNFTNYIKDNTSYKIDLLQELRNRVKIIFDKDEIRTQREARDISLLLNFYNKVFPLDVDIEKMNFLLISYDKKMAPIILKRQKSYRKIIKVEEKDGVEITSISISNI